MGLATSGAKLDWYPWPDWLPLRIITRSSTTSGRRSAQPGTRQSPAPSVLVQPFHRWSPGSSVPVDPVLQVDTSLVRGSELPRWIYQRCHLARAE
jgi:hypothetical protein